MPSRHPWRRILFAPLALRGRSVRRDRNLSYGPAERDNLLDVYHRRDARDGPVLVYFHGGGFRSGNKNWEGKPLLHRLARNGWVCISANYGLAPRTSFPGHLIDAKRAVAWARRHARQYGGDPSQVYVAGSSAGGHLATMIALSANRPEFTVDGDTEDERVLGALSLYGFYGSPTSVPGVASSPHAYLHADAPPLLLVHGDNDTIVLVDDARSFAQEAATTSRNPVVYAELSGAQHGFDLFRSARFEAVVDAFEAFVAPRADIAQAEVAPSTPPLPGAEG